MYSDTLPKLSPKPSFNIILEQDIASFVVRATATSSVSILDCTVGSSSPTLKLIWALDSTTMYDDVNLPFMGLMPQLESEKTAGLKPSCL